MNVPALCRLCSAYCPILVTVEEGKAVKIVGDFDAPLYDGYTCPKGRALPEQHNHTSRLLHSLKAERDGTRIPIASSQAMDEIAARIEGILAQHGPRSVAVYWGTGAVSFPAIIPIAHSWLSAIGSRMFFNAGTIDKPGVQIAQALHGCWQAGHPPFETAEAWIMVGVNPVISKGNEGFPNRNPGQRLKEAVNDRGLRLIVIDPRVTETAKRAHIHLQAKPGEDPTILASLLHVIIKEGLYDREFVAENADGFEALSRGVASFTPDYAARRADISADKIVESARIFAKARYAPVTLGTGPSFATHGSLSEYLALCLVTLCGHWARANDKLQKPNVLLPAFRPRAQASSPFPAWGDGERLRVRGLANSVSGLPTAGLAEEILLEGEGQIKALICLGGNPMMAWPDQSKSFAALNALDLLVVMDLEMTASAKLAHYVIAPKLSLETPFTTAPMEAVKYYGHTRGLEPPYARYVPKIVDPPEGSDVIEDWEFFYGLAQRMGIPLRVVTRYGFGPHLDAPDNIVWLDMSKKPSTDELLEMLHANARVPLSEVKKYPHGHIFDEVQETVAPRDPNGQGRLDIGNSHMMDELGEVLSQGAADEPAARHFPFLLIPRRVNHLVNSHGRNNPKLNSGKRYNPAFMHPADLKALGASRGDAVQIRSAHGEVVTFAEADPGLRRGLVSLTHGFGANPDEESDPLEQGACVSRLVSADGEYDPITGMPRLGALPVAVHVLSPATGKAVA